MAPLTNHRIEHANFEDTQIWKDVSFKREIGMRSFNDVSKTAFYNVDFMGLDMDLFRFYECTFDTCRFDQAILKSVRFERCQIKRSTFKKADLYYTKFVDHSIPLDNVGYISDCNFTGADLSSAYFYKFGINRCDFSLADMRDCDFSDVTMTTSTMAGAVLARAKLKFIRPVYEMLAEADVRQANYLYWTQDSMNEGHNRFHAGLKVVNGVVELFFIPNIPAGVPMLSEKLPPAEENRYRAAHAHMRAIFDMHMEEGLWDKQIEFAANERKS